MFERRETILRAVPWLSTPKQWPVSASWTMTSHVNVYVKPSTEHRVDHGLQSGPRNSCSSCSRLAPRVERTVRDVGGRVPFFIFLGKKKNSVDVFQLAGTQSNICPVQREQLGGGGDVDTLCALHLLRPNGV